jgi:hypothetical protein
MYNIRLLFQIISRFIFPAANQLSGLPNRLAILFKCDSAGKDLYKAVYGALIKSMDPERTIVIAI